MMSMLLSLTALQVVNMTTCGATNNEKMILTDEDSWFLETILIDTLRPRQDNCHFADAIFKVIFVSENSCILIKISLTYVPGGPVYHKSALV